MRKGGHNAARADAFAAALDAAHPRGSAGQTLRAGASVPDDSLMALVAHLQAMPLAEAAPGPNPAARVAILAAAQELLSPAAASTTASATAPAPLVRTTDHRAAHADGHRPLRTPAIRPRIRLPQFSLRPLAAGAVAAVIGVTGLGGVALAAHRSGPGDAFYGLKKATEQLQLGVSGGSTDRAKTRLSFEAARIHELRAIASPDASPTEQARIAALLAQIRGDTQDATYPLAYGDVADQKALWNSANTTIAELRALAPSLPASLQADLNQTIALLSSTQTLVSGLLGLAFVPAVVGSGIAGLLGTLLPGTQIPGTTSSGSSGNGQVTVPGVVQTVTGTVGGLLGGSSGGTTGGSVGGTIGGSTGTSGGSNGGGLGGLIGGLTGGLLPSATTTTGPTSGPTTGPTSGPSTAPTKPPVTLPTLPTLPSLPTSIPPILPTSLPPILPPVVSSVLAPVPSVLSSILGGLGGLLPHSAAPTGR